MNNNPIKQHWEKIYQMKDAVHEVSWYQDIPKTSVDFILSTGVDKNVSIIDIGGGDSMFADKLLDLGFKNIFVFLKIKAYSGVFEASKEIYYN